MSCPGLGDNSGAIAGRFVVLTFTRSWLGKKDRNLSCALRVARSTLYRVLGEAEQDSEPAMAG